MSIVSPADCSPFAVYEPQSELRLSNVHVYPEQLRLVTALEKFISAAFHSSVSKVTSIVHDVTSSENSTVKVPQVILPEDTELM